MFGQWGTVVVAAMCMGVLGCAEAPRGEPNMAPASDSTRLLGQLDQHLAQLTANIDGIAKRLEELRRTPDSTDPVVRELRALDLMGWELHREQWRAQRDHLQFARQQLQRVNTTPGERPALLDQWARHELVFAPAMEEFRQQRLTLERQRLKVESQLIERALRGL
ncbi:MAG: hypothetical protein KGO52_14340 [Nitrospirota bacterium]|nr:hypothetical protein [Nitrospirota bacterium]MDE3036773.1 hypothetical protein [Nitrospirota bacterium]MDE3224272.1 hypothetical protein [Nitrospirota bacterium]MDE3243891.1 hypothetical protein [Nitrospirota bacterium]